MCVYITYILYIQKGGGGRGRERLGNSIASNLIYISIHTQKIAKNTHLMIFTTELFAKGHGIPNCHECPPFGDN